ncbi:putative DNA-directed RNA polymerase [Nicotiana tabacum]|uniref:DNA-directed RNA polymerase n=1 Tax=Nicotiana tabacum TaxID=4097 RepID=A0AC58TKQ5_TOBAC
MIEEQTYLYDDIQSLFEATPMMINLLVKKDAPSAKEYLKASKKLTTSELDLLNLFHQYTLEGIIIYIFGCLFNSINESPAVRLSTLVDQLDRMARVHAKLLSERNYQRVGSKPFVNVIPGCITKNIGVLLVEFLLERELITTSNDLSFPDQRVNKTEKGANRKYYKQKPIYVICNFDLSILPVQLSLPMVYPPKEWGVVERLKVRGEAPKSLSDITGVEIDLLRPKFLANVNVAEGCKLLREAYLGASKDCDGLKPNIYPTLLKEFLTDIQRARYERFIPDIASAYEGYEFYLPAFLDFRSRIYRARVLHFHERDLARSLIVFSKRTVYEAKMVNPSHSIEYDEKVKTMLYAAASFHYQTFDTYPAAEKWVSDRQLPITQDASASAYQIISYFLLDFEIANCTNLIPTKGDKEQPKKEIGINDVYDFFVSEIKKSLIEESKTFEDPHLIRTHVCDGVDRKIVKSLLMPLIYGKTTYIMAGDLHQHYNSILLKRKECLNLSSHIEKFFKSRFPRIVNLMTLIRSVEWLASAMGRPVYYSTPVFTTVQDYLKSEAIKIWIYDRPM